MVKLISSDIDGTLMPEGSKEMNPEIYDVILELKKHNIHFVVASGRQLNSEQQLFAPVKDQISYIAENGAICLHEGKLHVITEFHRDFAMKIIRELNKFPNCKVTVSSPTTQYIQGYSEEFYTYLTKHLYYNVTVIDSFENIKEPIVKIAYLDLKTYQESLVHFRSMFEKEIGVVTAGNQWIDFIPYDSHKGTALKFILKQRNLSPSEAISFGDQQNDIEMLQLTEKSYAMAHARPEIKKYATDETESVVQTLRELIKIRTTRKM